jgi:hypothetical protein
MKIARNMHVALIGMLATQMSPIAAGKAFDQAVADRVMIFSPADVTAQPIVIHYEKLPRDISSPPIFFDVAEKRINLEKIDSNLLVPARSKPVNIDSAPALINDDRPLPPGLSEEDLEDNEPASEKLEN